MNELPVINIASLFDHGAVPIVDKAVGDALLAAGGFVVTGFPGADALESRAARLLQFFALPPSAKVAVATFPTNRTSRQIYRGYTSLLETDDFARTEWFDMGPDEQIEPPRIAGADILTEKSQWPTEEPYSGWRVDMEAHYADLQAASTAIMLSVGRAVLGSTRALSAGFAGGNSTLRLLRYPAPEISATDEGGMTLAAERHTDGSGLSLLWQAGLGLQAESADGTWYNVPQLPGSISVHLGDVLEMMTDGAIRATPHRVVDHGGERHSIGFFLEPALGASMTGSTDPADTYCWRALQRLRGYGTMKDLVPEPAIIQ